MKILNVTSIRRPSSGLLESSSDSSTGPDSTLPILFEALDEVGAAFLADLFDHESDESDSEEDSDDASTSQDVLCGTGSASAGLELHFEASQAYKDIIVVQHQRLQRANALKEQGGETEPKDLENNNGRSGAPYSIDLGLCSQILRGIAQNIEAQDSSKSPLSLCARAQGAKVITER